MLPLCPTFALLCSTPFIYRETSQGLLHFPLLMASPWYCGQTSAVSMLGPESRKNLSVPKQQAGLKGEENKLVGVCNLPSNPLN